MGEYDNLEKFGLKQHGDHWEQKWAPLVSQDFPAYEVFWRRYIVPLTNRIDPAISPSNRNLWIRLRPSISESLERMTMQHYSVFYYLARATERIQSVDSPFPEDVFALLDACGDNVLLFFKSISSFLSDSGRPVPQLPMNAKALIDPSEKPGTGSCYGGFVAVREYRDVILHNPVLGRSMNRNRTFLPRSETLKTIKSSWRKAADLPSDRVVDLQSLFLGLREEITGFLQKNWQILIGAFDEIRESQKFKNRYKMAKFLPVIAPTAAVTLSQRIVASGNQVYSATAGAAVMSSSTDWTDLPDQTDSNSPDGKNCTPSRRKHEG